ncbi:hypothetical protein MWU52_10510 [Jannaschia sp. S6380]|uniref:hypothetical protein n=1 Tax=Jannaschia sp. S6380 TaxID=2926408 RepID=UPI001FF11F9E|nr:hypothetical protein [Jannaschia sp. S6380]MCK0167982.1 hypothetical protein [Jannaschia sp. S6380]
MTPANILARTVQAALALTVVGALIVMKWYLAFVAGAALALSLAPEAAMQRMGGRMPRSFSAGIVLFLAGTLVLGEAMNFYEKLWWWDLLLHFGSAVGLGLLAFLMAFMVFEGERYAAPPTALAVIAIAGALAIGALWEIFEYGMDTTFGMNMQKSGLDDTMHDLIVDALGAAAAGAFGRIWLTRRHRQDQNGPMDEFVRHNHGWIRRILRGDGRA